MNVNRSWRRSSSSHCQQLGPHMEHVHTSKFADILNVDRPMVGGSTTSANHVSYVLHFLCSARICDSAVPSKRAFAQRIVNAVDLLKLVGRSTTVDMDGVFALFLSLGGESAMSASWSERVCHRQLNDIHSPITLFNHCAWLGYPSLMCEAVISFLLPHTSTPQLALPIGSQASQRASVASKSLCGRSFEQFHGQSLFQANRTLAVLATGNN